MSKNAESILYSLLEKTLIECNLRDVLKRHGISGEEIVRVDIESNNEIIASCHLPLNNTETLIGSEVPAQALAVPLTNLREEVVEILNKGQDLHGLVEELEFYKPKSSLFRIIFNVGIIKIGDLKAPKSVVALRFGYRTPCDPRECCAT